MELDTLITQGTSDEEEYRLNEFTDEMLEEDILCICDVTTAEAEFDEFYLIASGKYSKKMRQLFSSFEKELLELN